MLKLRLREQVLHHKPVATSTLALARQEVRDTAAATDSTLSEPPPLTLQHAGSSSGATLTNPADAPNPSLLPPLSRERQGHGNLGTNTSITPGQTEASGAPDSLSGDSVRKRSSFWKRSSTFISGGLARAAHKPISETHSSSLSGHASHAATEKTQPGQFRVLSSRIFNDSKHGSPSADSNASREYSASPLSPHSPRMYVDPASGMVSIWKDGKLAPLDTDCAAIQQAYHDLVATDPLLSIYYLVKERREREAGASARHHTTILLSQYQSSTVSNTRAAIDPSAPSAAAAAVGATGSKHGRQDSSETWVKLERAPDPAANVTNKTRTVAKEAEARQQSASKVSASADRDRDHAATLQIAHADGISNTPDTTTHDMSIDQTTAAIEALSLHPRARGPTQPSVTGASSTSQGAGFQDPRKKRSSIFKRFSVIVKGARPSQKHSSTPLDNTSYIVQAEGGESGYMEISLDSRGDGGVGDYLQQDNPIVANGAVTAPSTQLPANAELVGERLRSNVGGQRYSALDSIDEDREYVRGEDTPGASAVRTPANAANTIPLSEHEPQNIAPASQSLDAVGRQYLVKSLTPGQSPGCTAAEAPPVRGTEAAESDSPKPSTAPPSHPMGNNGTVGTDGAHDSAIARASDYDHPQPSGCSDASRSSGDLCGASSMFTNSELDESENTARNQLASRDGAAGCGEVGSPLSEKAALLDKARREIEGFDEHEGVGLLDQTPELNYRVAGQPHGSSFDAMKRRTRSSSNTVVRVLSEIVRDGSNNNNNSNNASNRGGKRAVKPSGGPRQRDSKGASSPPNTTTSGQSLPGKSIPRHNSTGAINSASGSGYFEDSVLGSSAQHVLQTAEAKSHDSNASTGFPRPDILRSQSHASASRPQGFVLPERIAEVSEPPTPREPWPENALKIDAEKDSERVMRTGPDKRSRSGNSAGSALVEFKLSPDVEPPTTGDTADSDDMHDVTSPPPRADEYLKPVFLK
ncbi:hypothetical protein GGH13_008224, partial [Coemansia sp. S155-1]